MSGEETLQAPGALWPAIMERKRQATQSGALETIHTEEECVEDGGVRFVVRWVSTLRAKAETGSEDGTGNDGGGETPNPFLPPDPHLTVGRISDSHVAVLNKFNVIDGHLLMVTRQFEHQERLLSSRDFLAFSTCLAEIDGLGFYNGGKAAGASQEHKHLQIVPFPLGAGGPRMPMDRHFRILQREGELSRVPALPWRHRGIGLDPSLLKNPQRAAQRLHASYRSMLKALGIRGIRSNGGERQSMPYNLLITRDFMVLIPRSKEAAAGISINALGFAGSLFVPERAKLSLVKSVGPMSLLRRVSFAAH